MYVEDACVCDDTGEPKGQCSNCGAKWYEHDLKVLSGPDKESATHIQKIRGIAPAFVLSEWDIKIIRYMKHKSGSVSFEELRELWAERCAVDKEYVKLADIAQHLSEIIFNLKLIKSANQFSFFLMQMADKPWLRSICPGLPEHGWNYIEHLTAECMSILVQANVSDLPGWKPLDKSQLMN